MMQETCARFSITGMVRLALMLTAGGLAGGALTACSPGSDDPPAIDASLSRDLSLASADSRPVPVSFGDTAAGAAAPTSAIEPAAPPRAVASSERVPVSAPKPTPAPSREVTAARPRPSPPTTPAPQAAATPQPETPATGGDDTATTATPGAAPAATPARRTLLGAGTELVGATGTRVCNTTNRPGDRVVMRLASDVTGADGTRLAAGTPVLLELAAANDSVLTFRVKAVSLDGELYPMTATATVESEMEGSRVASGSDKKKVIGGAIAGAILGQVLGKSTKGTVIGAAGGAAAGAVIAARSGTSEQCLAAGSTVRVVVLEPVTTSGTGASE